MVRVEIVEAKAHHCGPVVRRLRAEHMGALLGIGIKPHRQLRDMLSVSGWRRTLLIDGVPAVMAGLTGSALSSEGVIWIAVTERARLAHPIIVARAILREMDELFAIKRRLVTMMLPRDRLSMQLAYFLGFRIQPGSEGKDVVVMVADRAAREAA